MKRKLYKLGWLITCLIVIFLINGLAYAQTPGFFKPNSEPNGFRDVQWGQDISTIKDLTFAYTDPSYGGVNAYTRNKDELKIGDAELSSITYHFWQDKCCGVTIYVKNHDNWLKLKEATFERFGEGYQEVKFIENYAWFGKKTAMLLKYNKVSESGTLVMMSVEMSAKQEEWDKQKAKEGAADKWW